VLKRNLNMRQVNETTKEDNKAVDIAPGSVSYYFIVIKKHKRAVFLNSRLSIYFCHNSSST